MFSRTATVKIKVQNINEYSPEFVGLPYQFWVQESAIRNTRVGEVKAFDADGNNVFYSITGDDAGIIFYYFIFTLLIMQRINTVLDLDQWQ